MNDSVLYTINEVIKKQSIILGPDIAVLKAKEISELEINDNGEVVAIAGDRVRVLQKLVDTYVSLSGEIVKKAMEPLLAKHLANDKEISSLASEMVSNSNLIEEVE